MGVGTAGALGDTTVGAQPAQPGAGVFPSRDQTDPHPWGLSVLGKALRTANLSLKHVQHQKPAVPSLKCHHVLL